MKITKSQLKQIIKEEMRSMFSNSCDGHEHRRHAEELYKALEGLGTDSDTVHEILKVNQSAECTKSLYWAFWDVLDEKGDTKRGDLIKWLCADGETGACWHVMRHIPSNMRRKR